MIEYEPGVFPLRIKGTAFKHDEPSRVDVKLEANKASDANKRDVYRQVSERERYRCRVCDKPTSPDATSMLAVGHHHHIVYESAGGATTVENVCLLCAKCHNDEHKHRISIEGNANDVPWLTLSKQEHGTRHWYVWRQEIGVREYEHD